MKHTPGPWKSDGTTVYALTEDRAHRTVNRFFAGVQSSRLEHEAQDDELLANASLIAAAPDMLAMLEELEWINEVVEEGVTLCLCPECDTGNVHMPNCKLGNLLKRIKGGE